ncbi:MAG: YqgE/AlgH family protein [Robiginitomaculum sp.]|nr:YqgE/AlgH family protein [Robiginitomaculum sp.]
MASYKQSNKQSGLENWDAQYDPQDGSNLDGCNLAGRLIIASPAMGDKRFHGTVIYMCVHDSQQAMGIIINRPKPDLKLSSMLPHLNVKGPVTYEDTAVLYGGPVETERGFVLHSRDYLDPDNSLPLSDTLALTTSKSVLKALTSPNAPKKAVLALGYAGWDSGQLDNELMHNSWLVAPANDDIIFTGEPRHKWKQALSSLGITPEFLSASAGHA